VAPLGHNPISVPEPVVEAELYRNIAENGRELICQTGATGRYLYASPNHLHLLGYTSEELVGQSFFKQVHPDDQININRHYFLGLITHQPAHLQFRFRHKNGEWRWLETNGQPIFGRGGRWRATLILRDVTRERQAEEQLRQAGEFREALLACTASAVATLDGEGNMATVNAALCGLSGYEDTDMLGQPWLALIAAQDQAAAYDALTDILEHHHPAAHVEAALRDVQGGERLMLFRFAPLLAEGRVAGVVIAGEDMTELRQSEESREYLLEQLEIAQKLESIGKMSAGVAHDFNNVLMGALATNELLRLQLADRPDVARLLSLQQRSMERACQLTQKLLAFSRHESIVASPVDLHTHVRDILEFCSTQFDKRIEVDNRVPAGLPAVLGDGGQIDQILLNLLLNAGQALVLVADEGRAPRLTLDVNAEELPPDLAQRHGLAPGDAVLHLVIHDNGPGIAEELQAQIFDPFFTTKSGSQNCGLGLSTTYALVKSHGGAIEVQSQPGYETTFHVYLPVCTLEMLPGEDVQPDAPRGERAVAEPPERPLPGRQAIAH
jgi:PAS domain S-box-containing protein